MSYDNWKQATPPINGGEESKVNDYEYFMDSSESVYYKKKNNQRAISVCVMSNFVHIREVSVDIMQDADIVEATESEFMGEYNEAKDLLCVSDRDAVRAKIQDLVCKAIAKNKDVTEVIDEITAMT